jgi:CubicO group peptidase (beta-lactamase class C family)
MVRLLVASTLAALFALSGCRTHVPAKHPDSAAAPPAVTKRTDDPLRDRLALLDDAIDRERVRLKVPGASIVIVKDGKVIHARGYGTRTLGNTPVDADTLFAIGSTTKAFTAMLVMMAVEAGKVSLDDHPSKCLPDFHLRGENDKTVRVRDLLTHTTGLPTADLAWSTGQLTRDELVKLMGDIEPVTGVGKAFHYQNLGYLAAGQCAARALGGEYETLLRERILDEVGMGKAILRVAQMQASSAAAHGHHRESGGEVREVPMRVLDAIAPAGAINASANMLGGWLIALLGNGVVNGKPLLARKHFDELLRPQTQIAPGLEYALGWLRTKNGKHWYYTHTGGIDGFTAIVGFVPERGIGFAFSNNVDHTDLHGVVAHEVLTLLDPLEAAAGKPDVASSKEAGTYGLLGGFKVEVVRDGDRLALVVAGQPKYPLVFEKGRRYRLAGAAPSGFAAEFRPRADAKDKTELLLVQPFGDIVLPRLEPAEIAAAASATPPESLRELLGVYRAAGASMTFEMSIVEGRVALVVPGQPTLPIAEAGGKLVLEGSPADQFWLEPQRDGKKLRALVLHKPDGDLELELVASTAPPAMTLDKLLARRAKAHGSAALAKHPTMRIETDIEFIHQGLRGTSVTLRAAGDKWLDDVRLVGAGREIGRVRIGFDGEPWQRVSFLPPGPLDSFTGKTIALDAPYDAFGTSTEGFATAQVWRSGTIGKTPVVVLRFTTDWGATILESYDAKSFLLLRRELDLPVNAEGARMQETRNFSEYKKVEGVMVPYRVEVESTQGKVIAKVTKVQLDVETAPDAFKAPP